MVSASVDELADLARSALASGAEQEAIALLDRHLASGPRDAAVLHWQALLLRELDQRSIALPLLREASSARPGDPAIAHSLAQISLEAGLPAMALFEAALMLNPASSEVRLGLVSARFAEGMGGQALDELEAALANNPGWLAGHRQFAQLAALLGRPDEASRSVNRALQAFPAVPELWIVACDIAASSGDMESALELADRSATQLQGQRDLAELRAGFLDESGRTGEAAAQFADLGPAADLAGVLRRLRHHLRTRNPARVLEIAEPWLAGDGATSVWPYVSLAWRLRGDRHAAWLEGQAELIGVVDLDPQVLDLESLAGRLREIHAGSGRFLDQSVRGGTQTNGALFARIEPEIVQARAALCAAASSHIAKLPAADPHHPQLAPRRDRAPRFAGSWSVRLEGSGHHTAHHHPQGWFSSAFYVAVPDELSGTQGQLELGGCPPELGLDLEPLCRVAPKAGRLAIFPSTMWHGTLPFSAGERMSIAFDVAYPIEETVI